MFPVAPAVVVLAYVVIALVGAVIAILTGVLLSRVARLSLNRAVVIKDAFLGATGSVVTVNRLCHDPLATKHCDHSPRAGRAARNHPEPISASIFRGSGYLDSSSRVTPISSLEARSLDE